MFRLEQAPSLLSWTHGKPPRVLVMLLNTEESWEDLRRVADTSPTTVVALIPKLDPLLYAKALSAGASGVVEEDLPPDILERVIDGALSGVVILPRECARRIALKIDPRVVPNANRLDHDELSILRAYAAGRTTASLARGGFFSERTIRRKLQNACVKLGVATRQEAVATAALMGLLDSSPET